MWARFKATLPHGRSASTGSLRPRASGCYEPGERVRIHSGEHTGALDHVIRAPAAGSGAAGGGGGGGGSGYVIEIFVPDAGDSDGMNPFLVRQAVHGLTPSQLRPATANAEDVLGAVSRPGVSMCSVPMAVMHRMGLGPNARGRPARLGGLRSSAKEYNGLTGTVLWGPDEAGRYAVEVSLAEGANTMLSVAAECLTVRARRAVLAELVVKPAAAGAAPNLMAGTDGTASSLQDDAERERAEGEAFFDKLDQVAVAAPPKALRPPRPSPPATPEAEELAAARERKFNALDNDIGAHREEPNLAARFAHSLGGGGVAGGSGGVGAVAQPAKERKSSSSKRRGRAADGTAEAALAAKTSVVADRDATAPGRRRWSSTEEEGASVTGAGVRGRQIGAGATGGVMECAAGLGIGGGGGVAGGSAAMERVRSM
eukprot:NODE_6336_length_1681_cov_5.799871.p1 GENE.NODE_6336_length_1681_cov_5.799871~~NODE_6336_length_1681_cov_5.799871.p1  ORF type:complete len:428 (-),score=136.08 NODE_6336_length_1681_cov_5.799871:299-1582(-)